MTFQHSNLIAGSSQEPLTGPDDFEGFLIDDEFDDQLDRCLFEIREALPDFRNV
jgi:hypothetical protein